MKLDSRVFCFCALLLVGVCASTKHGARNMQLLNAFDPNAVHGASEEYCRYCNTILNIFITTRKVGADERTIETFMKLACPFIGKNLGAGVCESAIKMFLPIILYVFDNNANMSSDVCGIIMQNYGCTGALHPKWSIEIKPRNGDNQISNDNENQNKTPLHILHITDVHFDPKYSPTTKATCDKPLCCQDDGEVATDVSDAGGTWSDYRKCDVPFSLLSNAFEHIISNHKFVYLYLTGDLITHRFWDSSKEATIATYKTVVKELKKVFGRRVFLTLGNHDTYPMNLFPPESLKDTKYSLQWMFDLCAELWKDLLPENTNLDTIRRGGYYSAKTASGVTVISLNSNCASNYNFWLGLEDKDPYGQLQWFADSLQKAEDNQETVHVLTHIPSGDGLIYVPWATEYRKIIKRYSGNIAAIFQGHTHVGDYNVYYTGETPIVIGYSGGSLSPYYNVNPNYRIYDIDATNFDVIDYSDYTFNVTECQHSNEDPRWFKLYSFKEEYGVDDMSPASMDNLVKRMTKNETLRMMYYLNKVEHADPSVDKGCDKVCHLSNLCSTVTTVFRDDEMCDRIKNDYE